MSQATVAKRAGLSLRALRNIETGKSSPRRGSAERILRALRTELPDPPLWIGVLGPLKVRRGADRVELTSASRRNLLGFLALHYDRVVTSSDLADVLWPGRPPSSWRNLIHVHINRLRAVLEPHRRPRIPSATITSTGGGYQMIVDENSLDLARFVKLTDLGRAAAASRDHALAQRHFEQALACWRGPVLADSGDAITQRATASSLHHHRLSIALAYADLALAAGKFEQVGLLLKEIAEVEPWHERVHALLMRALAGNGQQAAAIGVYHRLAGRLATELGVDPGPALRQAYLATLQPAAAG
ncbi:hypothetical protein Rhe02_00330 [Rhizocola hellebori]|uniref:Uncharacterized protein n=1 Tax=Rhizocola hellebori TaxID=1392758 RepID=A0A8J3Q1M8_9ACTN|nr:hypothetical protein Rhe02_00330 [Rhizocola hellebori]